MPRSRLALDFLPVVKSPNTDLSPIHRLLAGTYSGSRPFTTIDTAGVPLVTYPKDGKSRFAERTLEMLRRAGIEPIVACEALEIVTA